MGFPIEMIERIQMEPQLRPQARPIPTTRLLDWTGLSAMRDFSSLKRRDGRGSRRAETPLASRVLARWIAVAGGCGYVPVAPGTAGSAAGAGLFVLVFGLATRAPWMGELGVGRSGPAAFFGLYLVLVCSVCVTGVWAAGRAERDFGQEDDGRIVIDEVAGQLVALAPLPLLLGKNPDFYSVSIGVVTGFVLFRLFDIWKPGAVRWAERRFEGGWGVMADDLVAGIYAAIVLMAFGLASGLASGGLS